MVSNFQSVYLILFVNFNEYLKDFNQFITTRIDDLNFQGLVHQPMIVFRELIYQFDLSLNLHSLVSIVQKWASVYAFILENYSYWPLNLTKILYYLANQMLASLSFLFYSQSNFLIKVFISVTKHFWPSILT